MEDSMSFDAVESQIKEARERAEIFASSLHKAREQEGLFEEERQKWVQTFEEKSIMIDQLERELTSTVDALNQEKQEKSVVQKQLVQSSWNVSNLSQSLETANQRKEPPPLPDNSYLSKHDDYLERGASDRRVLDLLQQSQEETTQARREITHMRVERDQLADQVSMVKRQLDRLTEDRDQLLTVKTYNDNKLQFRNEQVAEYEIEKERNNRKETELTQLIASLEKQIKAQRNDLVTASTEMRNADSNRVSLEERLNDYSIKMFEYSKIQSNVPNPLILQAKFDEMERIAIELTNRAELAESSLKMLMELETRSEGTKKQMGSGTEVLSEAKGFDSHNNDNNIDNDSDSQNDNKSVEKHADTIERQRQQQEQQDHQQRLINHPTTYTRNNVYLEEEEAALVNQQPLRGQIQSETPKNEMKLKKKSSTIASNKKSPSGESTRGSIESGDSHHSKSSRKSTTMQNLSLGSDNYNEPVINRKVNQTGSNQVRSTVKRPNTTLSNNPPVYNARPKPLVRSSSVPSDRSRSSSQPRFNVDYTPTTFSPSMIKSKTSRTASTGKNELERPTRPKVDLSVKSRGSTFQSTPSRGAEMKNITPHGNQGHNYAQLHTPRRTQTTTAPPSKVSITAKSLLKPSIPSSSRSGITLDHTGRKKLQVTIPSALPRKESPDEKEKNTKEGSCKVIQNKTHTSEEDDFLYLSNRDFVAVKNIAENFSDEISEGNFGARNLDGKSKIDFPVGIADIRKIGVGDINVMEDKEHGIDTVDRGMLEEKIDSTYFDKSYKYENANGNDNTDVASSILSLNNNIRQDDEVKIIKKIKGSKKKSSKKTSTYSSATTRTINSLNSLGRSTAGQ